MNKGQRVECTTCPTKHTGTVAHVVVPGVLVAVSWDGYIARPGRGTPEARAMKELGKAHNVAATSANELKVA